MCHAFWRCQSASFGTVRAICLLSTSQLHRVPQGSDIIVIAKAAGSITVQDLWSEQFSMPAVDSQQVKGEEFVTGDEVP
jgi:hypothetical protein